MNYKKHQKINEVEITDLGVNSKGIARISGMIVFVNNTIPGDVADIEIFRKKRKYADAKLVKLVKASPDRVTPECRHFGICGGCNLQNMNYEAQLKLKQKIVTDAFYHIGQLSGFEIKPILPSSKIFRYRNKLEFSFSSKGWLSREEIDSGVAIKNKNAAGFHIPGMFDKILNIDECLLQPDPSNEIRNNLKIFADENGFEFYDIKNNKGLLRSMIIRTTVTGETMVSVVFGENDPENISATMNFLAGSFPKVNSFFYFINLKKNDTLYDQEPVLFKGEQYIKEKSGDIYFKIGAKSFFQSNTIQAQQMYGIIQEFGKFSPDDIVYDLYSGIGSISLFIAKNIRKVLGIETVAESVEEAIKNAGFNNIGNAQFIKGEVEKMSSEDLINNYGKPDCIILDPPRAGLHKDAIDLILNLQASKLIYVSCNPATQARDINLLSTKYRLEIIQPVDMFPQTLHVENVSQLIIDNG